MATVRRVEDGKEMESVDRSLINDTFKQQNAGCERLTLRVNTNGQKAKQALLRRSRPRRWRSRRRRWKRSSVRLDVSHGRDDECLGEHIEGG